LSAQRAREASTPRHNFNADEVAVEDEDDVDEVAVENAAVEDEDDVEDEVEDEVEDADVINVEAIEAEAEDDNDDDFAVSDIPSKLKKGRGIFVPLALGNPICRDGTEMLVLAQIMYWFGRNEKGNLRVTIKEWGYYWVAKTNEDLAGEIGLQTHQVRHAIGKLNNRGILVKRVGLYGYKRSNYLRINTATLKEQIEFEE